ncbi:uncharacterized protein LOC118077553 [Zootoca vivipara]|uniref:uncharacterized protein LOC118077553 n=1 Tax=Zootoca vivipara TaxID=8524 RepID=UPI00293BA220|nr:uncharacterized protein LOC118077553 [Zootoca vivipara]
MVPSPKVHDCKLHKESTRSQSDELLSVLLAARGVRARSVHQQLPALYLPTIYRLLAALMQCLSLASLCIAVTLVKWVAVVQSPYTKQPKRWVMYNFGVPDVLEVVDAQQSNGTDIRKRTFSPNSPCSCAVSGWVGILHEGGPNLVHSPSNVHFFPDSDCVLWLIGICFVGMSLGFVAFLLDFIEIEILGKHRMAVATSLHILSGIFLVILLGICFWCFVKVNERIYRDDLKKAELLSFLGESFYIVLLSLFFVSLASTLSFLSMKLNRQGSRQLS